MQGAALGFARNREVLLAGSNFTLLRRDQKFVLPVTGLVAQPMLRTATMATASRTRNRTIRLEQRCVLVIPRPKRCRRAFGPARASSLYGNARRVFRAGRACSCAYVPETPNRSL